MRKLSRGKSIDSNRHALDAQRHERVPDADDQREQRRPEKHPRRPSRKSRERHAPSERQPRDRQQQRKRRVENREAVPRKPRRPERGANEPREIRPRVQQRKEEPHRVADRRSARSRSPAAADARARGTRNAATFARTNVARTMAMISAVISRGSSADYADGRRLITFLSASHLRNLRMDFSSLRLRTHGHAR